MNVNEVEPYRIYDVEYRCRDIGYGVEEGVERGFFTGETLPQQSYTFQPIGVSFREAMYLFPDEFVSIEPVIGAWNPA